MPKTTASTDEEKDPPKKRSKTRPGKVVNDESNFMVKDWSN